MTTTSNRRIVRTMCPMNCHPTFCGMKVEVEGDRVVSIRGDKSNPDSRGFLCIRGQSAQEIIDNPKRLLRPRIRNVDDWTDISWDGALEKIATAIETAGSEAVAVWPGHGAGVTGLPGRLVRRFTNLGGFRTWNPSIVCWGLGGFGMALTGPVEVNVQEDMAANAELILLWGSNLASHPTTGPHIVEAKKRGARVVAIDVRRTESFAQADTSYIIRPGADAALALALIHVIIAEGLFDRDFVAEHTVGFDELAAHVQPFTPEWAADETGIAADEIRYFARQYAGTKQSMILLGASSMNKGGNGWQAGRAVACLPALTGALGRPGGGFGPRHAAQSHGMGMVDIAAVPNPKPHDFEEISEMSTILDELESGRIKVLLLFGTNMVSSFADTGRLRRALSKLDLVVSHDLFMNDTARECAHIVLPGTSWLEDTGFKATNTHLYLMDQAIAPRGEARTAYWVMSELAQRLGLEGFFPWRDAAGALNAMFDHDTTGHVTVETLRAQDGRQRLNVSNVAHPDLRFPTPSGKVEFVSQRAGSIGLPRLPVYEPLSDDARLDPERASRYPLVFRQGRTLTHFHSFYDHGQALPSLANADPEPRLWLNTGDAAARNIAHNALVRLHNDRGEMKARAEVTDRVPTGVVWMRDGWRGMNDLTSGDRVVSDAVAKAFPIAGQSSYEARVEVSAI